MYFAVILYTIVFFCITIYWIIQLFQPEPEQEYYSTYLNESREGLQILGSGACKKLLEGDSTHLNNLSSSKPIYITMGDNDETRKENVDKLTEKYDNFDWQVMTLEQERENIMEIGENLAFRVFGNLNCLIMTCGKTTCHIKAPFWGISYSGSLEMMKKILEELLRENLKESERLNIVLGGSFRFALNKKVEPGDFQEVENLDETKITGNDYAKEICKIINSQINLDNVSVIIGSGSHY